MRLFISLYESFLHLANAVLNNVSVRAIWEPQFINIAFFNMKYSKLRS